MKLRDYQQQAQKDIREFIHNSEHIKGILVAPVASGKSILTSLIADETDKNCLIIQPNTELLHQNIEKARSFGLDPSIYSASAGIKEISKLTYATPMSIASKPQDFKDFDIVAIDEAHLSLSNKLYNGKVKDKSKVGEFLEIIKPKKIIGLTATPIQLVTTGFNGSELKMMNRSMRSFWYRSDIFHVTQIPDIRDKYWAKLDIRTYDDISGEFLELNSSGSEFKEKSIIENYEKSGIENLVMEKYYEMMSNGTDSILTFVPSVEQAVTLSKKNKDFEVIHANTPKNERQSIVEAFKRGDIPNLLNVQTATTGFDHPGLKGIIMARETNSFSLYYQMMGRICRPFIINGEVHEKIGIVEDLTGNTKRFGSIENITFEKNDYTNGWGMWNNDRLITGYPFGNWDMPKRSSLIKKYGKGIKEISTNPDYIILTFGKFKGKSLINSFKNNKNYFTWVLNNFSWGAHNIKLKKAIEKLIDKEVMYGK